MKTRESEVSASAPGRIPVGSGSIKEVPHRKGSALSFAPLRFFRGKRELAAVSAVSGSRVACSVLTMLGGLLTVRLLDPASLGFFNAVSLGQGYLIWLQFGIFNGLNRELPHFFAKGDQQKAQSLASVA